MTLPQAGELSPPGVHPCAPAASPALGPAQPVVARGLSPQAWLRWGRGTWNVGPAGAGGEEKAP